MRRALSRAELLRAERVIVPPNDAAARFSFALVSPNPYAVGMSGLALHSLWRLLAEDPRFRCERVFCEHPAKPAASVESGRPLPQFDLVGFSLSFELDYLRAVGMLEAAGLAPMAADRRPDDPLVIAGGVAVSSNPAPVAAVFDAILVGEAEEALPAALDVVASATSRRGALEGLAAVPGFYVPPLHDRAGARVTKQTVADLDRYATASAILTPHTEFADCHLVEVGRGCGRGCRFCLAGHIYHPHRQRSIEAILRLCEEGLQHASRIGLVGAALSDYRRIDELATALRERGARISTSSLRAESVSPALLRALAESGQKQITLAPEAGTERLRAILGKPAADEQFAEAIRMVRDAGIGRCKLYFMFGLPTETDGDLQAAGAFVGGLEKAFPGLRLSVSASPFVPKPHTPFQWEPMPNVRDLERRAGLLRQAIRRECNASLRIDSPQWAWVQAVLSRGGRELGPVIVESVRRGGSAAAFRRALAAHELRPEEAFADADEEARLPWDLIEGAPGKRGLWRQREVALRANAPAKTGA